MSDKEGDRRHLARFLSGRRAEARGDLSLAYGFAFASGLFAIAQAALGAFLVDGIVFGYLGLDASGAAGFLPWAALFLAAVLGRAAFAFAAERAGFAAAVTVMRGLRRELLDHVARLGPAGVPALGTGETVAALSAGVRAVEPFYTRYLPASMMAVLLPLAILAVTFPLDWVSGLIFLVTAPIIPGFMILIGKGAEARNQKQWRTLARLSGHLLDAVQGLATLKAFNAAGRMAKEVGAAADAYRRDTMAVLRIAFLSSLVLEIFATVAIAMAAMFIGFRLLWGSMDYFTGLFILLLAPEFFQPLRAMGAAYHARMEAVGAAERLVALSQTPSPAEPGGTAALPEPGRVEIRFEDVALVFGDGRRALDGVSLTVPAGARVALVGPSGAGKSSLLALALGFVRPSAGRVLVNGVPLADLDMAEWRAHAAYAGQRPRLFAGTLADNVAPGEAAPDLGRLHAALKAAGLADVVAALPGGIDGRVGEAGVGLSGGEAHRLALARAFYRDAPFLALDEPTAHLDPALAREVEADIRRLAAGRTVLFAAHRLEQAAEADLVVVLEAGRIAESGAPDALLAQGGLYARLVAAGALAEAVS